MTRARDKANSTVTNFASTGIDDNADANAITIDSSENVGIGNGSPASQLDLSGGATNSSRLRLNRGTDDANQFMTVGYDNISVHRANVALASAQTNIKFQQVGSDGTRTAMQIDSAGAIRLANTSMNIDNSANTATGLSVQSTGVTHIATSGNNTSLVIQRVSDTGTDNAIFFMYGSSGVGSVQVTSSSTAYNTSSDYRLKENVTYNWDATTRLKQLKPARFNFIVNADVIVDGFLAHEAQAVVPESVTGTHNEVEVWKESEELPDGVSVGDNKLDSDGNTIPVMQGIDQSKIVPLLTKALIESVEKIEQLEARLTALEAD